MEQNKDQGGAAVRGEAVAEAADDAKFWRDQCEALIDIWDDAQANPPESRAYVDEAWLAMLNGIRANLTSPVSARAADAPSEPSEAMERIFESWDGCDYDGIDIGAALRADFKTFVFGKSRAADALDSQPTGPAITPHHIELIQDMLIWPVTEDDARTARDMLQELHFDLSMASSQPTDGGVRNG